MEQSDVAKESQALGTTIHNTNIFRYCITTVNTYPILSLYN
jgi:hypothetical protein